MRKLAARYQHIRDIYKEYSGNVGALLSTASSVDHSGGLGVHSGSVDEWLKLRQKIEEITDKWLTHAQMCIQLINQRWDYYKWFHCFIIWCEQSKTAFYFFFIYFYHQIKLHQRSCIIESTRIDVIKTASVRPGRAVPHRERLLFA